MTESGDVIPVTWDLDTLLAAAADGRLNTAGYRALEARLEGDIAAQQRYVEFFDVHATLIDRVVPTDSAGAVAVAFAAGRGTTTLPVRVARRRRRLFRRIGLYATAGVTGLTLMLLASAAITHFRGAAAIEVAARPIVGFFTPAGGPGEAARADGLLRPGTPLRLSTGLVTAALESGVRLSVSGPADITFDGVADLTIRRGRVTVLNEVDGAVYRVHTAGGTFTDLGTRFGVSVDAAGRSELHVFEGLVSVDAASGSRSTVGGGEAVTTDADGALAPLAEADRSGFDDALRSLDGIVAIDPGLEYLDEPPRTLTFDELGRERRNFLFPEGRRRTDVSWGGIRRVAPARYGPDSPPPIGRIPAGVTLRSYLFHSQYTLSTTVPRPFEVTFADPVIAVALSAKELAASERRLGLDRNRYTTDGEPAARGFVLKDGPGIEESDWFELSPDRRTLFISPANPDRSIDQMRVFTGRLP